MAGDDPELAEVLHVAQTERSRFTTVRATVGDWSHYRRIAEVQSWAETRTTRRSRGARRPDLGQCRAGGARGAGHWRGPARNALADLSNWPLFDPSWITHDPQPTVIGPREVAGRCGLALAVKDPAGFLLPGADRCVGVIDRERGVLLRCEAWFGGELLMVEELTEVVFDDPLNRALFLPS